MTSVLALLTAATLAAAEPPVHSMGLPTAPITIELFSDFQCPGCKGLHESTVRELRRTYVNSGKVRLVYRDIHLPMHKHARLAACYACAAEKLGIYDTVADKLFETQEKWDKTGNIDEIVASVVPAAQMTKLRAIAADPAIGQGIDAATKGALEQARIPGTPTMIIHHGNQTDRVGQVSMPILSKYLDTLLAK